MADDVFLDARRATWNPTSGTGIYAERLCSSLPVVAPDLSFRFLRESHVYDGRIRSGWRRVPRWPRKALADLVEMPLRARGARLVHLLYPEAIMLAPTVVTIQDLTVFNRRSRGGSSFEYYRLLHERAMRRASRIICPSLTTARMVEVAIGREDVCVVSLGVDFPEDAFADEGEEVSPYVLYAGGYSEWKNVAILREVWRLLSRSWSVSLRMVGDPPPSLVRPQCAVSTGVLPREKLWTQIRECQALVYPSISEGFGFPIVEGLVMGKAVVCGNVGVVPELEPDSVITVDTSSPSSIAAGLSLALAGWKPSEHAVRWARRKFGWTSCARETAAIYRSCI